MLTVKFLIKFEEAIKEKRAELTNLKGTKRGPEHLAKFTKLLKLDWESSI